MIKRSLLPALAFAALSCTQPTTTRERYDDRIRYVEWTALDEAGPLVPPPDDVRSLARVERARVKLPQDFDERVWAAVGGIRGIPARDAPAAARTLSLEETIALDRDIVASWLTYTLVDEQPFTTTHGKGLTLDEYLVLGQGDCAQYAQSFAAVFDTLERNNPRLNGVVVTQGRLGGVRAPHDWNAIAVATPSQLLIAHVDVSDHDDGGVFEGEVVTAYPMNPLEFAANVYTALSDPETAFQYRKKRYEELRQEYNAALRAWKAGDTEAETRRIDNAVKISLLVDDIAFYGFLERDPDILRWARARSLQLSSRPSQYDELLYYSIIAEKERGYSKTAAVLRELLEKRYPDSFWIKHLPKPDE